MDPTPATPTLTRSTVRCPLTREGSKSCEGGGGGGYVGGWGYVRGVRRGLGSTSWVGGYVVDWGVRWGGGGRGKLLKNAVFGHFLESYYIFAAPG